ncbi:hypothetical protein G9A89_023752 [Geosiphon pyriformis]|nr:hypothetical protein G9A89_023752 [Geosiphon pyriformis]
MNARYYPFAARNFLTKEEKQEKQDEHIKEQCELVEFLLQQKGPEVKNFWGIVELERELETELENKKEFVNYTCSHSLALKTVVKHKSQINRLELLNVIRQQQNHELIDELNLQIFKKPCLMIPKVMKEEATNDLEESKAESIDIKQNDKELRSYMEVFWH